MDIYSGSNSGAEVSVSTSKFLVPEPEMLTREDVEKGNWSVYSGQPFAVVDSRILSVPIGNDETTRHIQSHEMVHAKISPSEKEMEKVWIPRGYASSNALVACEELRVHSYLNFLGFEPEKFIQNGTGKFVATRIAQVGTIKDALLNSVKYSRTAEFDSFVEEISNLKPEWAKPVKEISVASKEYFDERLNEDIASAYVSTSPRPDRHGFGYTEMLAKWIEEVADAFEEGADAENSNPDQQNEWQKMLGKSRQGRKGNELRMAKEEIEWSAPKKAAKNQWEELKVSTPMLTKNVYGSISKKRSPSQFGKSPRRISRLYTDPQRRIFDRVTKGSGGILLIDRSGSMSLAAEQVREMLLSSPNALVAQYSGGSNVKPNLYVIGKNGRMIEQLPSPNGGNGVDGPALLWAVSQRKNLKEPIIWVSDGGVTGKNDCQGTGLEMECINICKKNGIYVVPTADDAIEMLKALQRREKVTSIVPYHLGYVYHSRTSKVLYLK